MKAGRNEAHTEPPPPRPTPTERLTEAIGRLLQLASSLEERLENREDALRDQSRFIADQDKVIQSIRRELARKQDECDKLRVLADPSRCHTETGAPDAPPDIRCRAVERSHQPHLPCRLLEGHDGRHECGEVTWENREPKPTPKWKGYDPCPKRAADEGRLGFCVWANGHMGEHHWEWVRSEP